MLKNYFVVAYRSILGNKLFAIINILGLTIGITVCMSIFLIIRYELSFNQAIPEKDRIYRINSNFSGIYSSTNRGVPAGLFSFVKENVSGFELITPIHIKTFTVKVDADKNFTNDGEIVITNSHYFQLIGKYKWLAGNAETAMEEPFQVVLTESRARTYFGDSIPIHDLLMQQITYDDSLKVTVSGIVKDLDFNTDFSLFTDFVSLPTIDKTWLKNEIDLNNWDNTNSSSQLFIKLMQGTPQQALLDLLTLLDQKRLEFDLQSGIIVRYSAQPLSQLHQNKELGIFDMSPAAVGSDTLLVLGLVGLLILIVATINFINLETARVSQRAKEIGVRKVMGASRNTIIGQFLAQSVIIVFVASLVSLPLVQLVMSGMSDFLPDGLVFRLLDPFVWIIFFGFVIIVGLGSGFYPALVMSSFRPVQALKSQVFTAKGKNQSVWLRKSLTVFQFGFAQLMIVFALVLLFQMNFIKKYDLGFEQSNRIFMYFPWNESSSKKDIFVNKLNEFPDVELISFQGRTPATNGFATSTIKYVSADSAELLHNVHWMRVDLNYFDFYKLRLIEGRKFIPSDSIAEIVVNESMIRAFGLNEADEAIGKQFEVGSRKYTLVGVLSDFHFRSLHHQIDPQAFAFQKTSSGMGIKLRESREGHLKTLAKIEEIWNETYPKVAMNHSYISGQLEKLYKSEAQTAKLLYLATLLSIFISCMGLFGLASFSVTQRTKEIGIRKVLGATISQIIRLISRDFLVLIGISFLIAAPLAYYFSSRWLDNFAYHMQLGPGIFILTGFVTVVIALATLTYHAVRTARANPVDALRDE